MKLICKLFRFLLNIFEQTVNIVASALKTIGTAAIEVLGDLLSATSDALGLPKLALFAGLGLLAYWLITSDDDEPKTQTVYDERSKMPVVADKGGSNVSSINTTALA